MKETWTDIPGLEGKYQISNMGRYKRLSRYIQGRRLTEEPESGKGSQGKAWKKGTCI